MNKLGATGVTGGESSCEFDLTVDWNKDLSVDVKVDARLMDGSSVDLHQTQTATIARDASTLITVDFDTGEGAGAGLGHFEITIENLSEGVRP
jgi:hypothetical protein